MTREGILFLSFRISEGSSLGGGVWCEVWIKLRLCTSAEPHTIYEKIPSPRQ